MSGSDVINVNTARNEASLDASKIQAASSPGQSYEIFRQEVLDIDRRVKDESLRSAYQDSLVKTLGQQEINVLLLEYLKDQSGGAGLRQNGRISRESVAGKLASSAKPGGLTPVDKVLLPQLNLSFDSMSKADLKDDRKKKNSPDITDEDLRAISSRQASERLVRPASEANRKENFAQSILDPRRSEIFDKLETINFLHGDKDGRVSKDNIKDFLNKARNYTKVDKDQQYPPDMLEKLKLIYDNWDTPQIKLMREKNGTGNMTRDSIAIGCGHPGGYAEFAQKHEASKPAPSFDDALKTLETYEKKFENLNKHKVKYADCQRTFWLNEDGQLVRYTKVSNDSMSIYDVLPNGDVHENGSLVARNATFDPKSGALKYRDLQGNTVSPTPLEYGQSNKEQQQEFRRTKLSSLAKQETTQGYWQVAAKLIAASPVENEQPAETARQNVILMRALQALHRQQENRKLAGHEFLTTPRDFEILTKEINNYARSKSERSRTSAVTLIKRLEKLKTN